MEKRKLGRSGIEVSPLSLGCWALAGGSGWGAQDERAALMLGIDSDRMALVAMGLGSGLAALAAILLLPLGNIVVETGSGVPSLDELVPAMQRVQRSGKALHVMGSLREEDISFLETALSPDGLCLAVLRDD